MRLDLADRPQLVRRVARDPHVVDALHRHLQIADLENLAAAGRGQLACRLDGVV